MPQYDLNIDMCLTDILNSFYGKNKAIRSIKTKCTTYISLENQYQNN